MIRRLSRTLTIMIALTTVFIVCAYSESQMPNADPDELWNYITKESPYSNWKGWPDHKGMQPEDTPNSPFLNGLRGRHKVYVNDQAFNSKKPPVKNGGIVVKEIYSTDKKLKIIAVMYKIKDYNPDAGDWFWAQYDTKGKADKFGKPKGCIQCHGPGEDNDFILGHKFN
jgi:hypothetical protein